MLRSLENVESLGFDILRFLYLLSLALVVGGGFALGFATAPALFAELGRPRTGAVFGGILSRWDVVAVLAALALVVASALIFLNFETGEPKIYARYAAVAVTVLATLYASAWANPIARGLRRQTPYFDELPPEAEARREFTRYHARSRRAMTIAILAGLVALFLS